MSKFTPTVTSFLILLLGSILLHTALGSNIVSVYIKYFSLNLFYRLHAIEPLTTIASFFLYSQG